jgi:hypothetical protein
VPPIPPPNEDSGDINDDDGDAMMHDQKRQLRPTAFERPMTWSFLDRPPSFCSALNEKVDNLFSLCARRPQIPTTEDTEVPLARLLSY